MEYIIIIVIGYLIGSINFSILFTKLFKGIDIRDVNSHNPGASNTTLTLGLKWGVLVFVLDVLKGFIPVFVVRMLFPEQDILWISAGFSALIGHVFPVFYRFKGGKGTSTYMGVIFGASPLGGLILLVVLILSTIISDYIVIGTMFLLIPPPLYMIFSQDFHWISIMLICIFVALNIYKHSNNFAALFKGIEKGLRDGLKGR